MNKLLLVSICFLLSSCADPKKASKENFSIAANEYINSLPASCYFIGNFPWTSGNFLKSSDDIALRLLAKNHLFTEKEVSKKTVRHLFEGKKEITIYEYNLTPEGKKHYKSGSDENSNGKLCFGKRVFKEVISFTEPADFFGKKVSSVKLTYSVEGLPDITLPAKELGSIKRLKKDLDSTLSPIEKNYEFILTDTGWRHSKFVD